MILLTSIAVLCLALCNVQVSRALDWTSANSLPDGTTIPACSGQDVTLAWSYTAEPDEHLQNTEWHYMAPGSKEAPIASDTQGSFVAVPSGPMHVQFLPNAGIRLQNVDAANTGTYSVHVNLNVHGSVVTEVQTVFVQVSDGPVTTDGQLHVTMLQQAVYDNSTHEYHVQLACGDFRSVWQARTGVVWKTPSNQTLPSTHYNNGRFLLSVPNPVVQGEYSCSIDDTTPASVCVNSNSLLRRGATVAVDGTEARVAVMEARMSALKEDNSRQMTQLQEENARIKQNLQHLTDANRQLINTKTADLAAKLQTAVQQVFFHVTLKSSTSSLNPIVFEHVYSNVGDGYNSSTGYFTAPVSGTYLFMFTASSASIQTHSDADTYLRLYVNGRNMGYAYAGYKESGSNRAVRHLSVGDTACVNGPSSRLEYEDDTTFSGVLIQADM